MSKSLSARRAWIEIVNYQDTDRRTMSLSARRAWIEIYNAIYPHRLLDRRSPQGERG